MPSVRVPPGMESATLLNEWLEQAVEPALQQGREAMHTFGSAANVEERIRHRIGTRPVGFEVVDRDRACQVYRDAATKPADRDYLYVKCDTASAAVKLRIY